MKNFQPLEQFVINPIFINRNIINDIIFANMDLSIVYIILLTLLVFFIFNIKINLIVDIIRQQLELQGNNIYNVLLSIFLIILFGNLLGLIPGNFCVTAQMFFTLTLSSIIFFGMTVFFVILHGKSFFNYFIPKNVPVFLIPFLFLIEIASYVSRLLSLAIRLFANMVAGHALLDILSNVTISAMKFFILLDVLLISVALLPLTVVIIIYFLETGIAFLQAYVFTILSAIYIRDVFFSSH